MPPPPLFHSLSRRAHRNYGLSLLRLGISPPNIPYFPLSTHAVGRSYTFPFFFHNVTFWSSFTNGGFLLLSSRDELRRPTSSCPIPSPPLSFLVCCCPFELLLPLVRFFVFFLKISLCSWQLKNLNTSHPPLNNRPVFSKDVQPESENEFLRVRRVCQLISLAPSPVLRPPFPIPPTRQRPPTRFPEARSLDLLMELPGGFLFCQMRLS